MTLKQILKTTALSLPLAVMVGCGGGGGSSSSDSGGTTSLTGVLIDSAVSGVDYNCSSGATGVTNMAGEFTCNTGDTVDFSLGGVVLGSVAVGSIITPTTLFPNNPAAALNLAQLLQTFDTDPLTDGISLAGVDLASFITSMGGIENIDFTANNFDTVVGTALSSLTPAKTLISNEDAQQHLDETFATLGINPDGTQATDTTAPTFTSSATFSVAENQTAVGTITTDDETATLTLSGTDEAAFTLTDGVLAFRVAPDFETKPSYSVSVIAKDASNNETTQTITVGVTDLDEVAPTFTSDSEVSVNENATSVVTVTTDDAQAALTLGGTDATLFSLSGGVLSFKEAKDFELDKHTYSVEITATDSALNSSKQSIVISLVDVDESIPDTTAPTFTSSQIFSAAENQTAVGTVTLDEAVTLTLGGDDAALFTLTGGVLTFNQAPNFEATPTKTSFSVTVTAKDSSNNETTQTITVNLTNVAETVPQIAALSVDIDENPSKSSVGVLPIISTGDTPIESITLSGAGSEDFRVSSTGEISVVNGAEIDYETQALYTLSAVALNGAGESSSVEVSIAVNNLAEIVPVLLPVSLSIVERSVVDTELGEVTITQAGDSTVSAMRLEGEGNENFDISVDGLITVSFMGYIDYETTPNYTLQAIATNEAGDSEGVDINITVTDVDESTPTLNGSTFSVSEAIVSGDTVGTVTISSAESTAVANISLSGVGADTFSIGVDGVVTLAADKTLNMRVKKNYELKAIASNDFGSSQEVDVNISLTMDEKKQLVKLSSYEHGQEPWISDGTPEGTYLLKDIGTELNGAFVKNITEVNGKIFFTATTPVSGEELYVSDGTEGGTTLVKDVTPGAAYKSLDNLTKVGDELFFTKDLGYYAGFELWKSDGTEEGTLLVKAFSEESNYNKTELKSIYDFNGLAILSINESTHNIELWKSDGTEGGTTLLKDIHTSSSSYPEAFTHSSDTLYFRATSADEGSELYKSDGTPSGTVLVKDIYSGSASSTPQELAVVGDTLYFTAFSGDGTGHWIYKSDGSEVNTSKVVDFDSADKIINFKDELYVFGMDPSLNGGNSALFKFNGTGLDVVKELPIYVDEIIVGAEEFYIVSKSNANGIQIWESDGTTDGTAIRETLLADSSVVVEYPMVVGDTLYFYSNSNAEQKRALWRSTATQTQEIERVSRYQEMAAIGTKLLFGNIELYATTGEAETKEILARVNQSTTGSSPESIVKLNNRFLFRADDGIHGAELWVSDGTESGTYMLKDIYEGDSPSNAGDMLVYDGKVYFSAEDGIHGKELWSSDGTTDGTVLVEDIYVGSNSSGVSNIISAGDKLYFTATNDTVYNALWSLDSEGVTLVQNYEDREIDGIIELNEEILFTSYHEDSYLYDLEKIDKNSGLVVPILVGTTYYSMWNFNVLGDSVYFLVDDDSTGESLLFQSDGTPEGTSSITYNGNDYINPEDMFTTDSAVVLAYYDDVEYGTEVFKISGSTLALTEDVVSGSDDGYDDPLAVVGDKFYFMSKESKLWFTNGEPSGTAVLKDFSATPGYINYGGKVGEEFLFSYTDSETRTPTLYISDGTPEGTTILKEDTR